MTFTIRTAVNRDMFFRMFQIIFSTTDMNEVDKVINTLENKALPPEYKLTISKKVELFSTTIDIQVHKNKKKVKPVYNYDLMLGFHCILQDDLRYKLISNSYYTKGPTVEVCVFQKNTNIELKDFKVKI